MLNVAKNNIIIQPSKIARFERMLKSVSGEQLGGSRSLSSVFKQSHGSVNIESHGVICLLKGILGFAKAKLLIFFI
jgi:hypothetical protein